ncbi:alpha/beta fold hydrolase [Streptomyces sp.]|uniref:thioesterase II family protein n=1 Tax=Streptomyces sp. TaxID=1931 RepID=UPI002812337C|nr:alpha/beta fold hydrolase [Streptomyces sp.]
MPDALPWIRPYPSPGTSGRPAAGAGRWSVLFFPHSGGSADSYRHLASHLSGDARTACVQYPGRAERHREPLFTDLHRLADDVAPAFARWRGGDPVLIFGHSLGAAVAYEVVRRTADQGRLVLAVSGHPAPSHLALPFGRTTVSDEQVVHLVRELGGIDAELLDHPLLRQLFLPVIRADLAAHARYRPGTPPGVRCPIVALMGDRDPLTNPGSVQAWQELTRAPLRVHTLAGGHFFTNERPEEVAGILRLAMTFPTAAAPPSAEGSGAGAVGLPGRTPPHRCPPGARAGSNGP